MMHQGMRSLFLRRTLALIWLNRIKFHFLWQHPSWTCLRGETAKNNAHAGHAVPWHRWYPVVSCLTHVDTCWHPMNPYDTLPWHPWSAGSTRARQLPRQWLLQLKGIHITWADLRGRRNSNHAILWAEAGRPWTGWTKYWFKHCSKANRLIWLEHMFWHNLDQWRLTRMKIRKGWKLGVAQEACWLGWLRKEQVLTGVSFQCCAISGSHHFKVLHAIPYIILYHYAHVLVDKPSECNVFSITTAPRREF